MEDLKERSKIGGRLITKLLYLRVSVREVRVTVAMRVVRR